MMNSIFSTQILTEKLAKLNNSQQSIETVSHWCIFHRKKAKQVVETWEKLLNSSSKDQRIPFLYLANDILQNSRRKGSEFVNEYWKVLPGVLKSVFENGDEHGKNVVTRLVDIWDERKVFGSRSKGLKDEIFSKEVPSSLANNGKNLNLIRIVKKDSHTIRIKLAVGCSVEKIVSAFQSVQDEHLSEDTALNKIHDVIQHVEKVKEDFDGPFNKGSQEMSLLVNALQEQEGILEQCIEQLEIVEVSRQALISTLKEALQEQETKLERAQSQIKVARSEKEHLINLKQRLTAVGVIPAQSVSSTPISSTEASTLLEQSLPTKTTQSQPSQPVTSFASYLTPAEEQHKKAAAEVAAKLTASTSSAQMLTSVLSSLVAEEVAASMNVLKAGNFATGESSFPPEKRPKLEKPMSLPVTGMTFFGQVQQQQKSLSLPLPLAPVASSQPMSQSYPPRPPLPPPPPLIPPPPPQVQQQYIQSSGALMGAVPYGFGGANNLPPPLPPPSNLPMGVSRPSMQPPLQQKQQQDPAVSAGFFQSAGIGFYGQPSTTPVPRQ